MPYYFQWDLFELIHDPDHGLGRMDDTTARTMLLQVITGLEHLHLRGIGHRDLSADNVLVDLWMPLRRHRPRNVHHLTTSRQVSADIEDYYQLTTLSFKCVPHKACGKRHSMAPEVSPEIRSAIREPNALRYLGTTRGRSYAAPRSAAERRMGRPRVERAPGKWHGTLGSTMLLLRTFSHRTLEYPRVQFRESTVSWTRSPSAERLWWWTYPTLWLRHQCPWDLARWATLSMPGTKENAGTPLGVLTVVWELPAVVPTVLSASTPYINHRYPPY